jgi:hypothetical protein
MAMGTGRCAALAAVLITLAGAPQGWSAAKSLNTANDKLTSLTPTERDAALAKMVGHWCIGSQVMLMGEVKSGPGEGNAYWSVRCAGGGDWVVQLDPLGGYVAIDCKTFAANGAGKECFKKF